MHPVTLPDNTAYAKVPDGWQVAPKSGGGTFQIMGPHQEFILLNGALQARSIQLRTKSVPGMKLWPP
jgi:hypothetical protein